MLGYENVVICEIVFEVDYYYFFVWLMLLNCWVFERKYDKFFLICINGRVCNKKDCVFFGKIEGEKYGRIFEDIGIVRDDFFKNGLSYIWVWYDFL